MPLSTEDLDQIAAMIRNSKTSDRPLKADVDSASDDFSNTDQVNAGDLTEQIAMIRMNKKRTADLYQDLDISQARRLDAIFSTHLANTVNTADMISKQAIRHSDVAADALWTDELNPVVRGAGDVMAGQAPVNSQLSSTASLDSVFTNLTAQVGEMVTAIVGLANSQAAQNLAIAQMLANAKQA